MEILKVINWTNILYRNGGFYMRDFLISAAVNVVLILVSFFVFKNVISGPTRHRIYEKFMSSFAKFVIYIFVASAVITGGVAFALYRTNYVNYINIVAPAFVSIIVGFVAATVPVKGAGDEKTKQ
jgi:hypothetical protein